MDTVDTNNGNLVEDKSILGLKSMPISYISSELLVGLYSIIAILAMLDIARGEDPVIGFVLLIVSPLLVLSMMISTADMLLNRRVDSGRRKLQWRGLLLAAGALPVWYLLVLLMLGVWTALGMSGFRFL